MQTIWHKYKVLLVAIIFLIVGFAVYVNSFSNQFFWDDNDSIVNNTYVRDFQYLPNYFSENLIAGSGQITNYWRPLLLISFATDYHLHGLNPAGFHVTNTLLHILAAWLSFILLYGLTKKRFWLSFIPSLLFLIHPLQTEAVTYIAGRADPLSTVLSLAALIYYVKFRSLKRIKLCTISLIFFILGLLVKEQVIFLPFLVVLIELLFFYSKKDRIRSLKIISPFLLISIIYFILRITVLDFNDILSGTDYLSTYNSSLVVRLFTFALVILKYFKLLFLPFNLHMAYEINPVQHFFSWPVLGCIVLLLAIFYVSKKLYRKEKLIAFGWLWFFIILLPRTNIIQINKPLYEHWLYLPSLGFWLALVALIFYLAKKYSLNKTIYRNVGIIILIIITIYFSALTIKRNLDWHDPITFYEKNLQYTPNSFIQKNNLGMAYAAAGRHEEAIQEYQQALAIKDVYAQVHSNLANSLYALDQTSKATEEYYKALAISPTFVLPYKNLATIYIKNNDLESLTKLSEQLKENTNRATFLSLAGSAYFNLGDYNQALSYWEELVILRPDDQELQKFLTQLKLNLLLQK